MDDLIIIVMILILAVLSLGIRCLVRRVKALNDTGDRFNLESPAFSLDATADELDGDRDVTIFFSESAKRYRWIDTNDSLLEFAETRGIEVESLCRAGECGSCRTRLIEGEVEYQQQPSINPGRGYCLLCISKPRSNLVLKI